MSAPPGVPERDRAPVTIERSDAIDAAGALVQYARAQRKAARSRSNGGPANAAYRAWLRSLADEYDAAARRIQAVVDDA